jgi:hypothetical protein
VREDEPEDAPVLHRHPLIGILSVEEINKKKEREKPFLEAKGREIRFM